jgi:hypothetical protein
VKKDKHISNLKNIKEIIPLMKVNDELIYDIKIKCKLFNNLLLHKLSWMNVDLPNILSESEYVQNNINITESDGVDLLNILDISKAIGPDGISPRILKEGA